jgi:hypothetical protein
MSFFDFSKEQVLAQLQVEQRRKHSREQTRLQHMIDVVGKPPPSEAEFIEKKSKVKKITQASNNPA